MVCIPIVGMSKYHPFMQSDNTVMEEADQTDFESRRREPRHKIGVNANVQVVTSPDPDIIGENFDTKVLDASPGGMRLACDIFLDDCELGIWVEIEPDIVLFVAGEARWAREDEGSGYQVGIQLNDNPLAQHEEWSELWK